MALKKCKECGKEVSTKADKCPHCGVPLKRKPIGCLGVIFAIALVIVLISIISHYSTEREKENARLREQKRTAEVEQQRAAEVPKKKAEEKVLKDKKAKKEAEFLESVDTHYQQLIELYKKKDFEKAEKVLDLFLRYNKLDYKDVDVMYRKVTIWSLDKRVRTIPASNILTNLKLYEELLELDPNNQRYKQKVAHYTAKFNEYRDTPTEKTKVSLGTLADKVLELRGKAISSQQVGSDEYGLLVEWEYPDVTYLMGRRVQDGVDAYRVIKITPRN